MSGRTANARLVTLVCLAALLMVLSVEIFAIVRLGTGARAVLWAMCCLPLVLFVPGLLRGAWRTYQWLCFVACVYFFAIVDQLFRPDRSMADAIALVLVVVLFVSAMLFARWRQRELAAIP